MKIEFWYTRDRREAHAVGCGLDFHGPISTQEAQDALYRQIALAARANGLCPLRLVQSPDEYVRMECAPSEDHEAEWAAVIAQAARLRDQGLAALYRHGE